jgi:hypothetical protein
MPQEHIMISVANLQFNRIFLEIAGVHDLLSTHPNGDIELNLNTRYVWKLLKWIHAWIDSVILKSTSYSYVERNVRLTCINADEFSFRGTNALFPKAELSTELSFICPAVVTHNIECN